MKMILSLVMLASVAVAETTDSWQEKMVSLSKIMGELLPEIFVQKSDVEVLKKNSKALAELTHNLSRDRKDGKANPPNDDDPSVEIIAGALADEAKLASVAIQEGKIEYGKKHLQVITAYCIACHTRHNAGPDFPIFPLSEKTERLTTLERARLLVATRQFSKGLDELRKAVQDQDLAMIQPLEWDVPLRTALSIAVRVKNDPQLAGLILDEAMALSAVPDFQKANLVNWKKSIQQWTKESKKPLSNEKAMAKEMRRLMKVAHTKQLYPRDRSAEIEYLRASRLAHDLLRTTTNKKLRAEAILNAGVCYEVLSNPVIWPMHEMWYKYCIAELPHTPTAKQCFRRLEETTYLGFQGTSGAQLAPEVKENLQHWSKLADPGMGK